MAVTNLFFYAGDLIFDNRSGSPEAFTAANLQREVLEHTLALKGVRHFGVELDAVEFFLFVDHAGDGARWSRGHQAKAFGHGDDFVTVAHPHIEQ